MIPTPYEDLLRDVMAHGTPKSDRTGTGTRSVFGRQLRFDLAESFPLITTKRVHFRSVALELLWMLSGSTNNRALSDQGVRIWSSWGDESGDLGPTYGKQFRHVGSYLTVRPRVFAPSPTDTVLPLLPSPSGVRNLNARTVNGVGYYGAYDRKDPLYSLLATVWREMMKRCYDEGSKAYASYGGAGVHVSERWQCFANFQADARRIPNWELKFEYPDEYSLDKDTRFASNRYDVGTCMWASEAVQNANRSNSRYFTATDPEGNQQTLYSIGQMKREHGLNVSAVHRCLTGKLRTHHGWSDFSYIESPEGFVTRYNEVDQVKALIASIRHNPDSRRHLISLWNPSEVPMMALPPCHGNVIQFYVADGKLSCSMYQRSADALLGIPFNIASYALLTLMVAQQVGLEPGEFIWTGGDVHVYDNHVEQVAEQLSREPYPYPRVTLRPKASIFDYTLEDITVHDYQHHPTIKAPVAV